MIPRIPIGRSLAAGLSALGLAAGLRAQNAGATPSSTPVNDQVVTLSEFDVNASSGGYMPTESSTGSRMAVKVKDLPFAVSSVTSEYIKDFGIFALTDELAFSSSMSGINDTGGFNLRGFGGNISLRNGFSRLGFFDPSVYDRIEFIKGPEAAIYGQTNPGGLMNFITKQPRSTAHQSLDQVLGSYKFQRTQLELTGPIPVGTGSDPKLYYIFDGAYDHRRYESPNQASTTRQAYLDFLYKFSPGTTWSFDFDYEYRSFTGGTSGTGLPEIVDVTQSANSPTRFTGIAFGLIHKYYTDASQWNHRTIFNYESIFESKINDVFSVRAAGNIYRSPRFTYSTGLSSQFDPTTRNLINSSGRSNFSFLQGDGVSGALDALAHYNIPGQGEQKTLFTVDYYKNIGKRPSWSTAAGSLPTTFNVDNPAFNPYVPFTTPAYTIQSNSGGFMEDDYARSQGASLRQFGKFLDSKLTVALGLRADRVYTFKEFAATATTPFVITTNAPATGYAPTNWSKEVGLGYAITNDFSAYVNRTESFVPNSPSNATGSAKLVNQTGLGYEAGFKGALRDSTLNFSANVFWIRLKGVYVTEIDPTTNLTVSLANGTQFSKGVEFDGSWQVLPALYLQAAFSYNNAYYGDQGVDLDLKGRQTSGVPKTQEIGALVWEAVHGLKFTAHLRSYSKFRVDNTAGAAKNSAGFQVSNDGRRNIWGPAYTVVDLGAIYQLPDAGSIRHRVQLDVKNVFNKTYAIVGSRVIGDKVGVYATYSLSH